MHNSIYSRGLIFLLVSLLFAQCSPRYGAYFKNTPIENHNTQTKRYLAVNENEPEETLVEDETNFVVESFANDFSSMENEFTMTEESEVVEAYQPSEELLILAEKLEQVNERIESVEEPSQRKEIHREQKQLKKELKREVKKEARQFKNEKIWIGTVIGVAGILVAILVSGTVGGIAIIVGIGFIAWGLIEQGGI